MINCVYAENCVNYIKYCYECEHNEMELESYLYYADEEIYKIKGKDKLCFSCAGIICHCCLVVGNNIRKNLESQ